MKRLASALLFGFGIGSSIVACGGDKVSTSAAVPPPPVRGAALLAADAGLPPLPKAAEFTENDFAENDRNRDPFRSYVSLFVDKGNHVVKNQLPVVLPQYAIDELKLVAIVMAGDYPRAMLLDPTGKGWIVKRGDYLGRPDTVHTGGSNGTDYQLNWRVDRVREGDLVLSREDRALNAPPATRVIPLHPDSDKLEANQQRL
jgi:type IV pilus assembly protein PilP